MNIKDLKIGIVGAGDMGTSVARLSALAGFEVFVSNSRGPESLMDLASKLGTNVHAVSVAEAIQASDLIVVSIPFSNFQELPLDLFKNKIVIDAMNFIPFRDDNVQHLLKDGKNASQIFQEHLNGAPVVKTFSNIYSGHLFKLSTLNGMSDRSALPIAGDDRSAKATVVDFLDAIGWDAVDAGALSEAIRFAVSEPCFVKAYMIHSSGTGEEWGSRINTDPGKSLNKNELTALLFNS